jgi:hypothetical protein
MREPEREAMSPTLASGEAARATLRHGEEEEEEEEDTGENGQ